MLNDDGEWVPGEGVEPDSDGQVPYNIADSKQQNGCLANGNGAVEAADTNFDLPTNNKSNFSNATIPGIKLYKYRRFRSPRLSTLSPIALILCTVKNVMPRPYIWGTKNFD